MLILAIQAAEIKKCIVSSYKFFLQICKKVISRIFCTFFTENVAWITYWICRSRLIFFACNMTLIVVSVPEFRIFPPKFWPVRLLSSSAVVISTVASGWLASKYMAFMASWIRWLLLWDKDISVKRIKIIV